MERAVSGPWQLAYNRKQMSYESNVEFVWLKIEFVEIHFQCKSKWSRCSRRRCNCIAKYAKRDKNSVGREADRLYAYTQHRNECPFPELVEKQERREEVTANMYVQAKESPRIAYSHRLKYTTRTANKQNTCTRQHNFRWVWWCEAKAWFAGEKIEWKKKRKKKMKLKCKHLLPGSMMLTQNIHMRFPFHMQPK